MYKIEWNDMIEEALTVKGSLGNVYNRFYSYSFLNQLLLNMQGVCEPVATYKSWQSLGRQVKTGSKAKEIIRPITLKEDKDDPKSKTFTAFKSVRCIFGLSDTDGVNLGEPELPEWDKTKALEELEIKEVPFEMTDGNTQGYSFKRNIAISPIAVFPVKTMFHELAHILCGHTEEQPAHHDASTRNVQEFQAECVAFIVHNELGLGTEENNSESRAYIQGWLKSQKPNDREIRKVFSTVDKILRAGKAS